MGPTILGGPGHCDPQALEKGPNIVGRLNRVAESPPTRWAQSGLSGETNLGISSVLQVLPR